MKILLVEDDVSIAKALEKVLMSHHYAVDVASDGRMGWQLVETCSYDLVLLDIVLPRLDGIEFCQRLRSNNYLMPVLLITAQDSGTSKVIGLNAGADDYLTKPFEVEELLARIRVLLRRSSTPMLTVLEWGGLRLDPNTREVAYCDRPLSLTPKEYRLLELFLRKPPYVFTRSAILENLWAFEEAPTEDTVTAHVKGLRRKLKQAGAPSDFIKTVYGVGYRLKPLDAIKDEAANDSDDDLDNLAEKIIVDHSAKHSTTQLAKRKESRETEASIHEKTKAALATVWQKTQPQTRHRLSILKYAIQALLTDTLTESLRHQAKTAAHGLTGALGVFGFQSSSQLAKVIESHFDAAIPQTDAEKKKLEELVVTLEQTLQTALPESSLSRFRHTVPLLLVVDDSLEFAYEISDALRTNSLNVAIATDIANIWLNQQGSGSPPKNSALAQPKLDEEADLVVLNFPLSESSERDINTLINQIRKLPPMATMICTGNDTLKNRVRAARLGACSFLCNLNIQQVLEIVIAVRSQLDYASANVLVVDDDPQTLSGLRSLLEPWGFELTTLEQTPQFWQVLESCSPDLLVLDVEMPHFNGIDLCRVVRHTPPWSELPIVFLTAHTDANTEHEAFTAGANDLIDKASAESELITRLFNQLGWMHVRKTMTAIAAGQ